MVRIPASSCLLAAAALLLAGCAAGDDAAPQALGQEGADAALATPEPHVLTKTGTIGAGAGASSPAATCWAEVAAERVLQVGVPAGASAVVFEVDWDDDTQDLTLSASSPSSAERVCPENQYVGDGFTGLRDHPVLLVESPEPGTWTLGAQANGAVANVSYTLYATVFFGAVPDGYTATG